MFYTNGRKNCNTAFTKQLEGTSPNHSHQSAAVLQKQNSEITLKTAGCEEVLVSTGTGCSKQSSSSSFSFHFLGNNHHYGKHQRNQITRLFTTAIKLHVLCKAEAKV